jgi:hypothetical protein
MQSELDQVAVLLAEASQLLSDGGLEQACAQLTQAATVLEAVTASLIPCSISEPVVEIESVPCSVTETEVEAAKVMVAAA